MNTYVTEQDYVVIGADALKIIQNSKPEIRERAELQAQEQISGYLREWFDMDKVWADKEHRNPMLVQCYCDIALYTLVAQLPNRMGHEIRKERYDNAIKWLETVSKKEHRINLPAYIDDVGKEKDITAIRYGAGQKNTYDW